MARLDILGEKPKESETPFSGNNANSWQAAFPLRRWSVLFVLGVLALPLYRSMLAVDEKVSQPLLLLWPLCGVTALSVVACWQVLKSYPAEKQWLRWAELGLILALGLAARSVFFATPPTLSHDAYRYVWDPHLLTHGLSPYTHTPFDPAVQWLQDRSIWPNLRFRQSPTIYPPGAQMLFLLLYVIKPLSIGMLKVGIEVCDGLVALLTLLLLRRHRLDLRRVIIYWWSPIPIIEFASSAHVDAAAIAWTLVALLVFGLHWRGAKGVAGMLLGMGALTKLYPALFTVVFARRRSDWTFLVGLVGIILLGYLAFWPFGAQSGGYLATYIGQGTIDRGFVLNFLAFWIDLLGGSQTLVILVQGALLVLACGGVGWLWWRKGLRPESGVLMLSVVWILLATHLFTWYFAILLPLLALYLRWPTRAASVLFRRSPDLSGRFSSPVLSIWFFTLAMPFTYVFFAPHLFYPVLFQLFFIISFALAALPLFTRQGRATLHAFVRRTPLPATVDSTISQQQKESPHDLTPT